MFLIQRQIIYVDLIAMSKTVTNCFTKKDVDSLNSLKAFKAYN